MAEKINYKKTTISGLMWRYLERIGVQLITLIVSVILARKIGPEAYGDIAVTAIFITICNVFVTSGFGVALVQKKDADELDFSSVFYSGLVISIVLYIGLWFVAPYIADFFDVPIVESAIKVLGLRLPISALGTVQNAYVDKHFMFRKYFYSTLIATVLSAIVGITMAFTGFGIWALVAKELTNIVVGKIVLFFVTKWYPKWMFSWKRMCVLMKYSWKILCAGLINTLYTESTSLILAKGYSDAELSYYSKGKSWPQLIGENIDGPINNVLFPVLSKAQNDKDKVKNITRRSIKTSCYVVFAAMVGLAAIAPVFTFVILGADWAGSIPYMQIMCFIYAFYPVHTANLQAIKAVGKSGIYLILEIIKKAIGITVLGTLILLIYLGKQGIIVANISPIWIAVGSMFTTITATIINAFPNRKLLGYSWGEQMKDILPYFGLALLMGAPVYAMNYLYLSLGWNMYLVLVLQVIVGIGLYVGFSRLFKIEQFKYLLQTIKEFFKKRKGQTDKNKKKLLIIGANPETISLIVKAKKMGYITYVTDYNPKAYAKKFASIPCNVDGMDIDGIVKLVHDEKIDAVLVGVAEALMPTYCEVCNRLNIPCFATLEQFDVMTHKDKFKSTCREYGVPVVEEFSVNDLDSVKYPAIVKPVDSSSSKGISICSNREELDLAIEKALSFSPSKTIIIEKYMDGVEAIAYYVIQDGKPTLVAMCDRYTSKEQEGITQLPSAYIFPSKHLDKYVSETDEKVCNMLKGMNIQNGVLFLQAFVENGSVKIYEPGFRLNGAQEHIIVSEITGIDAKELLINYAFNGRMSEKDISTLANPAFNGKWACKLSPLVKEGVIGKIEGLNEIKAIDGVVDAYPNYEEGSEVKGLGTQRQMLANIFIVTEDKERLKACVDAVIKCINVYDESGCDMLLKPFETEIIISEYQSKE